MSLGDLDAVPAGRWPRRLDAAHPPTRRHGEGGYGRFTHLAVATGADGELVVEVRGSDRGGQDWTDVLTTAHAHVIIDERDGNVLDITLRGRSADGELVVPGVDAMVGSSARSGFRAAIAELLAPVGDRAARSLLRSITFDVPMAMVLTRCARPPFEDAVDLEVPHRVPVDICAGLRSGSTLPLAMAQRGPRRIGHGPSGDSSTEIRLADVAGERDRRTAGTVSRVRCLEVSPAGHLRSSFRDTVVEQRKGSTSASAGESVVHEYVIDVEFDPTAGEVRRCVAVPVVLPGPECPVAAASASGLVGERLDSVRHAVDGWTGTATCTHLTDALWQLGAAPDLLSYAER